MNLPNQFRFIILGLHVNRLARDPSTRRPNRIGATWGTPTLHYHAGTDVSVAQLDLNGNL